MGPRLGGWRAETRGSRILLAPSRFLVIKRGHQALGLDVYKSLAILNGLEQAHAGQPDFRSLEVANAGPRYEAEAIELVGRVIGEFE